MENEEAACLGAAILAGAATGIYSNLKEAAAKLSKVKKRIEPEKDNKLVYQNAYSRYLDLYNSLQNMFEKV